MSRVTWNGEIGVVRGFPLFLLVGDRRGWGLMVRPSGKASEYANRGWREGARLTGRTDTMSLAVAKALATDIASDWPTWLHRNTRNNPTSYRSTAPAAKSFNARDRHPYWALSRWVSSDMRDTASEQQLAKAIGQSRVNAARAGILSEMDLEEVIYRKYGSPAPLSNPYTWQQEEGRKAVLKALQTRDPEDMKRARALQARNERIALGQRSNPAATPKQWGIWTAMGHLMWVGEATSAKDALEKGAAEYPKRVRPYESGGYRIKPYAVSNPLGSRIAVPVGSGLIIGDQFVNPSMRAPGPKSFTSSGSWIDLGKKSYRHVSGAEVRYDHNAWGWRIHGGPADGELYPAGMSYAAYRVEHAARHENPRRKRRPGAPARKPFQAQAFLFDRQHWTEARARQWLKKNGHKIGEVSLTDEYIKFKHWSPYDYQKGTLHDVLVAENVVATVGIPKSNSDAIDAPGYNKRGPRRQARLFTRGASDDYVFAGDPDDILW